MNEKLDEILVLLGINDKSKNKEHVKEEMIIIKK